jgi:hypothetical protein
MRNTPRETLTSCWRRISTSRKPNGSTEPKGLTLSTLHPQLSNRSRSRLGCGIGCGLQRLLRRIAEGLQEGCGRVAVLATQEIEIATLVRRMNFPP